jgi:hypothetical protein
MSVALQDVDAYMLPSGTHKAVVCIQFEMAGLPPDYFTSKLDLQKAFLNSIRESVKKWEINID